MSRSASRILFVSSHCLTDSSSGAAIATVDVLRSITRSDIPCRAFCAAKFDAAVNSTIDQHLADLQIPVQTHEMPVADRSVRLFSLLLSGIPVTVFPTHSRRIDEWSQGESTG